MEHHRRPLSKENKIEGKHKSASFSFFSCTNPCPEFFCKKNLLKNFAKFTGKNMPGSLFFNKLADMKPATLLKKEALTQVFSSEVSEIFKNPYFKKHLQWLFLLLLTLKWKTGIAEFTGK